MKNLALFAFVFALFSSMAHLYADTTKDMSPEDLYSCAENVWARRDKGKMNGVLAVQMCEKILSDKEGTLKTENGEQILAKAAFLAGSIYVYGGGGVEKDAAKASAFLLDAAKYGDSQLAWSAVDCALEGGVENGYKDCIIKATFIASQKSEARQAAESKSKPKTAQGSSQKGPKPLEVRELVIPGGAKVQMIYCPPGEFIMGSPTSEDGRDNDEIQHRVCLTKGFWLGMYEITQEQWRSVMGHNPAHFRGDDSRPVERVSWEDCQRFVKKINDRLDCGARLPTEAEWEYACRAGTTTAYSWGNSLNGTTANCNGDFPCGTATRGPYFHGTTEVGRYSPNPWGFYDMHGNVYEWCQDICADYPSEATDPIGPAKGSCRVQRSGCWSYGARFCRSANRTRNTPTTASPREGLRLCCDRIPD